MALSSRRKAASYIGAGIVPPFGASLLDWLQVEGVGSLPTIAIDFTRSKAYGASLASMVSNLSGVSAAGLAYSSAQEVQILGALRSAIQGTTGTLFVETGPSTGGNNTDIIGGAGGVDLIARGGNAVVATTWNGSAALVAAPDGSQGQSFDTNIAMVALRWTPSGRALSAGGGSLGTDANAPGDRSSLYIGKRGDGGAVGSGKLRAAFFYATALTDAELTALTFCSVTTRAKFNIAGDSMPAGSGSSSPTSTSWWATLNADLNTNVPAAGTVRYINQLAVGGTTSSQARAAFLADATPKNRINILWTGHNSPNASQSLADLQAMVAAVTGDRRYLILLPVQNSSNAQGSAGYNEIIATRNAIRNAFPVANVLDIPAALAAAGNGGSDNAQVAAGYTPPSLLADTIHVNDAGQAVVKAAVKAKLLANGWAGWA